MNGVAYPRDPMSLPLGLYGLPITGNVGEETAMTQASNDAYTEFRRQMLSQVNATKGQFLTPIQSTGSTTRSHPIPSADHNATIRNPISFNPLIVIAR